MALSGVSPALAGRLVETALDGLEQVERTPDGCWRVAEPAGKAVRDVPFVCVAVEQAREGRNVRLGWSVVQGGELSPAKTVTLVEGKDTSVPRLPAGGHFVVFTRKKAGLAETLRWLQGKTGADAPVWELRRAVQNLFPGRQVREPAQAARLLGETWLDEAPADAQAERLAVLWLRILEIAGELGLGDLASLREELRLEPEQLDFSRFAFGPEKIAALPTRPGVYLMRDRNGKVAYVGKAKNLAARIPAYFRSPDRVTERDRRIVREIVDFEVIELGSELEALLVEQRLIGLYRPRLNTQTEVHPRSHWERVRGNYALVLPSAAPGHAEVFLINRGGRLRQVRTRPGLPNRLELEGAVSALFFEGAPELGISVEGEIAFSWMARVQPWEQTVLVDRCESAQRCVDEIGEHVKGLLETTNVPG
ncbi:MAG TPA: nucleotide excision repair endonuclease [Bacteroidetes bacterium]|nr:nucleotide excision repair endonuclease [Bacteroidota bacterium]